MEANCGPGSQSMIPILLTILLFCLSILTNQAAFFCVASAIVTGWTTFQSGRWVLRNDPVKQRGRICFLFHLSVTIWLGAPSAGVSLLLMAGLGFRVDDLKPTGIALLGAIALSSLIGLVAVLFAWVRRVKIWAHPAFEKKLLQELRDELPPTTYNYALFVTVTSVSLPILCIGAPLLITPVAPAIIVFAILGPAFLAGVVCVMVSRRILASGPKECLMTPPEGTTVPLNDNADHPGTVPRWDSEGHQSD